MVETGKAKTTVIKLADPLIILNFILDGGRLKLKEESMPYQKRVRQENSITYAWPALFMNRRDDRAGSFFATDPCEEGRSHAYGCLIRDSLRAKEQTRARQYL